MNNKTVASETNAATSHMAVINPSIFTKGITKVDFPIYINSRFTFFEVGHSSSSKWHIATVAVLDLIASRTEIICRDHLFAWWRYLWKSSLYWVCRNPTSGTMFHSIRRSLSRILDSNVKCGDATDNEIAEARMYREDICAQLPFRSVFHSGDSSCSRCFRIFSELCSRAPQCERNDGQQYSETSKKFVVSTGNEERYAIQSCPIQHKVNDREKGRTDALLLLSGMCAAMCALLKRRRTKHGDAEKKRGEGAEKPK